MQTPTHKLNSGQAPDSSDDDEVEADTFACDGDQTDVDEGPSDVEMRKDISESDQATLSNKGCKAEMPLKGTLSTIANRTPVVKLRRCDSPPTGMERLTEVESVPKKTQATVKGTGFSSVNTKKLPQETCLVSSHSSTGTPQIGNSTRSTKAASTETGCTANKLRAVRPETSFAANKPRAVCPETSCVASIQRAVSPETSVTANKLRAVCPETGCAANKLRTAHPETGCAAVKTSLSPEAAPASDIPGAPEADVRVIRTRSRGPLPPPEEKVKDKYPVCDGTAFKDGNIPKYKAYSEYRCSKCDKTFLSKQRINRHMKSPRCDIDEDLFRSRKNPCPRTKPVSAESDEDWTPSSALATKRIRDSSDSDEDIRSGCSKTRRKQKRYRTQKEFTIEEFMAGKIQIPIGYYAQNRSCRYYSHYTCKNCSKVFVKIVEFREHCSTAHPKGKSPSGDGTVHQGPDPESLEILRKIKERYLFCCPHCNRVFTNREQHKMHVWSHGYIVDSKGTHICKVCGDTFQKLVYLLHHSRIPKGKQICTECGLVFTSKCQIQRHMKAHEEARKSVCQSCGKSLIGFTKKEIKAHMKTHCMEQKPLSLCPKCGKGFSSKYALDAHMFCHSDERPFACAVCHMVFKRRKSLQNHTVKHREKTLQCDRCGQKFFYKSSLNSHKQKHLGICYRCMECGKRLSRKSSLRQHIQSVHRKIKRHPCSFCELAFYWKDSLKVHLRTHTGEKPFQCTLCPAKFVKKKYLRKHVRIHTGEKPYACDDCSQSFACLSSLKFHRKKHHSNKTYPCSLCSVVFPLQSGLDRHKQVMHGDYFPPRRDSKDLSVVGSIKEVPERNATAMSGFVAQMEMDGNPLNLVDVQAAVTMGQRPFMSGADPELGQCDQVETELEQCDKVEMKLGRCDQVEMKLGQCDRVEMELGQCDRLSGDGAGTV